MLAHPAIKTTSTAGTTGLKKSDGFGIPKFENMTDDSIEIVDTDRGYTWDEDQEAVIDLRGHKIPKI